MSVGIIGGADGPTAIFITGSTNWALIIGGLMVGMALIGVYVWRKRRRKKR